MLQYVAVFAVRNGIGSGVLQYVAVCCVTLQYVAVYCSVCSALQCVAVCCSALQCVAVCCNVLQCVVTILTLSMISWSKTCCI